MYVGQEARAEADQGCDPMAELPEIYRIAQQMQAALPGKTFANFEIIQPKCLNLEPEAFVANLRGATIQKIKTGSTSNFICPNCQAR